MKRLVVLAGVLLVTACGGSSNEQALTIEVPGVVDPVTLVQKLREGGLVVYLRHAATDRSEEDTDTSNLENCATQRNLTAEGREQARAIGRAFRELDIPVGDVLASEYCRTRETAELAFGSVTLDPDLTGFPNEGDPGYQERVRRTRELLRTKPAPGTNTILVAHIKNIEAATGISIEEGELAVFLPRANDAPYLGRIPASAWPQLVQELGP